MVTKKIKVRQLGQVTLTGKFGFRQLTFNCRSVITKTSAKVAAPISRATEEQIGIGAKAIAALVAVHRCLSQAISRQHCACVNTTQNLVRDLLKTRVPQLRKDNLKGSDYSHIKAHSSFERSYEDQRQFKKILFGGFCRKNK